MRHRGRFGKSSGMIVGSARFPTPGVGNAPICRSHAGDEANRDPVLDVGSIPCQPTYASFEVWRVTAPARAVEAERSAHRRDR
jgi:hypothetical protein